MAEKPSEEPKLPPIHIEEDSVDFPLDKLTGRGTRRAPFQAPQKATDEGRVPPQATDIEQSVLGAMLIDPEAVPSVIEILQPDDFYDLRHRYVYEAILRLFEKSNPVDLITVRSELARFEKLETVGGAYYLTELSTKVATAANIEFHSRIVAEKSLMRKLIDGLTGVVRQAYQPETDPFDLLDSAEQSIFAISENNLRNAAQSIKDVIKETLAHLESIQGKADGITGVPTGFHVLDQMTSGWQKSDLIIIAARPSMGKTAFSLSMIQNAAINKKNPTPVVVFSLEMSAAQLAQRLLTAEARIDAQEARTGRLSDESFGLLAQAAARLSKAPIFIDDTPALSIMELRAKCRRLKAEHDIGLVVVDYLQLMTAGNAGGKGGNREQEIALISRSLKALAKEINVPVIALAQLSRAVEQRGGDKRPQLSDLRESGSIEQDADVVGFIYRAERYGITVDDDGNSTEGTAEIIIGKQRNGPIGSVTLAFVNRYARFENLTTFYSDDQLGYGGNSGGDGALPPFMPPDDAPF